jgi:SAM-dependent methyltransferase
LPETRTGLPCIENVAAGIAALNSKEYILDAAYGQIYEDLYHRHWWFRVRECILLDVIRGLELPSPAEILDVGCGNGLFFGKLGSFGSVSGIEIDSSLVPQDSPHRGRIFDKPLGDPCYEPLRFDLITALDVIEHIEDDHAAVDAMLAMLRPGGKLVITVPASMLLWDRHDEINRHYRRYSSADLRKLLAGKGKLLEFHHLFHALFLPKLAIRTVNRLFHRETAQHAIPPAPINAFLTTAGWMEYRTLRVLRIPFGTSLMAVLEKPSATLLQCGP